jgi:hypothetical protein
LDCSRNRKRFIVYNYCILHLNRGRNLFENLKQISLIQCFFQLSRNGEMQYILRKNGWPKISKCCFQ